MGENLNQADQPRHGGGRRNQIIALAALGTIVVSLAWLGRSEPKLDHSEPASGTQANADEPAVASSRATESISEATGAARTQSTRPAPRRVSESTQTITFRQDHGYQPHEFEQDRMQIYEAFKQSVESWSAADLSERTANRDKLSGRDAYEVYVYLRSCLGQPESVEQADAELQRLENIINSNPRNAERLLDRMDQTTRQLERCETVGTDGTGVPLMHDWLALAADLGFAQAQLAYHLSARWVLSMQPEDLFREPDRVLNYRNRAIDYLQAALRAGHPDALLEYARAIDQDVVFVRDPVAAYAYAYAAEQGQGGMPGETERFMQRLEPELDPSQLRDAREQGRALCERYCRR